MSTKTQHSVAKSTQFADLVMEGGGVKGAGLVGAVEALHEQGYQFPRIAGTSAGAIVGALLAAGMPPPEARRVLVGLNFQHFRDPSLWSRLGPPGQAASLLFTRGIYRGDALREWLDSTLQSLGVRTFADLRITDEWASALPPSHRYKLVVMVADIGRGRLLRLPWDYHLLGRDPDKQLVADAVRASASIPFFYQPVKVGRTLLVDGGLLSNFPVDIFDAHPSPAPWPAFGIKLSAKVDASMMSNNLRGVLGFPLALLNTLINAYDQVELDDPATTSRTIFVDTGKVQATDFALSRKTREILRANGEEATKEFLRNWDHATYIKKFIEPKLAVARAALRHTAR